MARRAIQISVNDNVAVALVELAKGEVVEGVQIINAVPSGHKFALRPIHSDTPVIKLGHAIGLATTPIAAGEHVHSHNLAFAGRADRSFSGEGMIGRPVTTEKFLGYVRPDGRVGTRNFIGVLTSVNCSATVAKRIAAHFTSERLSEFPQIDGVVALSHASGCGMSSEGRGMDNLRRTITGYATHPNFAAVLIVGLGCEVNQIDPMLAGAGLGVSDRLQALAIQDAGGTKAAIEAGIGIIESMLSAASLARRAWASAAHLTIGLQCGASDGYSAITANPALGIAADKLVAAGGRIILSETPEIFGAEDLLLKRASSPDVAQSLIDRLDWWEDYAAKDGASLDNNPSPGNKAGGITTILEKSLGAVAKAGSSSLNDVIDYAAPVVAPGLTFMDSPGYDPCSATGQIAGGANMILFTTGRGSVFGSLPAPTLKLASNALLAKRMADDIDIDCSTILDSTTLEEMGAQIFAKILATASGEQTASEANGIGESEWVPWIPGPMF